MPNVRTYQRAFNGGEVSPEFLGRLDDTKYQMGLALCQNFVVLPHGPVMNRSGFEFVREAKNSATKVRLIPFVFSLTQTFVIELGAGYFRFHTQGGTVLSGASPYELSNPYTEDELFSVRFVQSADVLTLVHPNHPPRELRRLGATDWQLSTVTFGSALPPPENVAATATTGSSTTTRPYDYVVTAVAAADESLKSLVVACTNNLDDADAFNTVTWDAVVGAEFYNVYREEAGVYAFVGQTTALTLIDRGITPDVSITPPNAKNPFANAGDYPSAVTYFEQRRVFAGTRNSPQTLWLTKSGTESNLNTSLPLRADDALSFRIAAREVQTIQHLVPLQQLLVLTAAAEWRVGTGDVLAPDTLAVQPQSFVGAGQASPLIVNNNLLFAAQRGGHVRELGFSNDAGGFITGDLSLRATHLFDGYTLVDSAQAKSPYPICWWVSSAGWLLGLTYVPEQQVYAWHRHITDGVFESVACVAEGDEDYVYAVVRRTISGEERRYVERMASRRLTDDTGFFVDAGVRYSGPEIATISGGLAHLEGREVAIVADGAVHPRRTVQSGTITLDRPASSIVIGLPIEARLKTLPFSLEVQGYGQGLRKNVNEVWVRVDKSRGMFAGPTFDKMYEYKQRTGELPGDPPALASATFDLKVSPTWGADGELCIEQRDPLPLTVLSLAMEVAVAG